jgi:hypothetical protein
MTKFRHESTFGDEIVYKVEYSLLEVNRQCGVDTDCFEGFEVKAADELPSAVDFSLFI